MVIVKKQKGESDDKLIMRFKKQVLYSGILQEVRDRQRHKTEAEKRKEKKSRIKHQIEIDKKRNH
jgi:ribosomal protein S21